MLADEIKTPEDHVATISAARIAVFSIPGILRLRTKAGVRGKDVPLPMCSSSTCEVMLESPDPIGTAKI